MTVEATIDLGSRTRPSVQMDRLTRAMLGVGTRDAVNASALAVVTDARVAVQHAVGGDQRLGGVLARWRNGRRRAVTAETKGKGGTRINPYYRDALAEKNPTALVGVRGPAHYIEHRRRGGYTVKPQRAQATAADVEPLAELDAQLFGRTKAQTKRTGERLRRRRALTTPQGYRAKATPGPITVPIAPITRAFNRAAVTVRRAARDTLERSMSKAARNVGADLRDISRAA